MFTWPGSLWRSLLAFTAFAAAIQSIGSNDASGDDDRAIDEALLRRIDEGDADALAELYDRRIRLVFSLACRIVEMQTEAEEVAQDVFMYVWSHAARFDARRGTVAAWLLVMTRSRSLDRLRARRTRPDTFQPNDNGVLAGIAGSVEDSEQRLLDAADVDRLRAALSTLTPGEREPIDLAYFGGLTQREIAERLNQPLGTVKTRVRTGLMRLRAALSGAPS